MRAREETENQGTGFRLRKKTRGKSREKAVGNEDTEDA